MTTSAEKDAPCPAILRCPDRRFCPLVCQEAGSREDPNHRPSGYVPPGVHSRDPESPMESDEVYRLPAREAIDIAQEFAKLGIAADDVPVALETASRILRETPGGADPLAVAVFIGHTAALANLRGAYIYSIATLAKTARDMYF